MNRLILPADREETLKSASDAIIKGGVIAYPTETLYGLGARFDNELALSRVYELKERPADKAMPLIIGSIHQLDLLTGHINDMAIRLITRFWPGPLTLIFQAKNGLNRFITSEGKIAVRIPGESFALKLVRAAGMPITSTSANISGKPAAANARIILEYFGDAIEVIADGGDLDTSRPPSTIIDVTRAGLHVIREGAVPIAALKSV
jgi:L-threonylcarbamoyladenylate synthase